MFCLKNVVNEPFLQRVSVSCFYDIVDIRYVYQMDTFEIRQLNTESQKEVVTVILCSILDSLLDQQPVQYYRNHCIIGCQYAHCPNEISCLTYLLTYLWYGS